MNLSDLLGCEIANGSINLNVSACSCSRKVDDRESDRPKLRFGSVRWHMIEATCEQRLDTKVIEDINVLYISIDS